MYRKIIDGSTTEWSAIFVAALTSFSSVTVNYHSLSKILSRLDFRLSLLRQFKLRMGDSKKLTEHYYKLYSAKDQISQVSNLLLNWETFYPLHYQTYITIYQPFFLFVSMKKSFQK